MLERRVAPQELRAQKLLFCLLATALPLTVLFNVEVWLQSSYTGDMFHLQGFLDLYRSGIFRYRVLGPILLLKVNALLLHYLPQRPFPMPRDPRAELTLVLSYEILNGTCFFVSNLLLLCFMWTRKKGFRAEALTSYFFTILLMAVSMAVVTPYDQLAYFLLLLAVVGARAENAVLSFSCVGVSAVAGMLNRETEFLATALLVTLAGFTSGPQRRRLFYLAAMHLLLCLAVYFTLRTVLPGHAEIASVLIFGGKWALPAAVVMAGIFGAGLLLVRFLYPSLRPAGVFTLLSVPYLLPIFLTGVLRELRLLVPMLLCLFCLYEALGRTQEKQAVSAEGSPRLDEPNHRSTA